MGWYFDPNRATQAAYFLMECSGKSRMPYLKMLKLLYFADRASVAEKGYPITGDDAFAMDYGPVLTRIYDYIKCKPRKGAHIWAKSFRTEGYDLEKVSNPGTPDLSRYDKRILQSVYDEHKDLDGFDLSQLSHDFPEWVTTYQGEGTSTQVPIDGLLDGLCITGKEERAEIKQAKDAECKYFDDIEKLKDGLKSCGGGLLSA